MTDTQQKYFLTVSEELSFSRAARVLYVSQPAVSKQIAAMEAELGFTLFDRTDKTIRLTEAGELFREFLLSYQHDLKITMDRIKNRTENSYHGTIKIGCPLFWNGSHFFDKLSSRFAMNYPDVKLELNGYGLKEIPDVLRSGEIDVGLVYDFVVQRQPDISSKPFTELNAGLLYSARHFESLDASSGLSAFSNETFIVSENDGGPMISKHLNELCVKCGFMPNIALCPRLPSAILQATCGKGVLFMDEWGTIVRNPDFVFSHFDHRIPVRIAYLSKNMTTLKALFVNEAMYLFSK